MNSINHWAEGIILKTKNPPGDSYWNGADSEELFKKTMPPGWSETSIIYRCNSYGYRTTEFDFASPLPTILCLGCSFTEGIGNKEEDTWVSIIKNSFPQYNVYNLGVGGASNDTIARILTNVVSLFNPEHVFILWTHFNRFESYHTPSPKNSPIELHGPWDKISTDTLFLYDDPQSYNNFAKNKLLVNQLSKNYNFKLHELEYTNLIANSSTRPMDRGRDEHPGPLWQKQVATEFLRVYNN
jgi:hypothetical protein